MLDAYAVRKAIPRILLAVIGINLSIYLCVAAVDITTVVGRGVGGLLTTPFVTANHYDFIIEGNVENAAALAGGAGIFLAAGGLGTAVGAAVSLATAPLATLGTLAIMLIPIALVALAVLATLVIRQALLLFLIIVSPVAIACFVLPGTEKYFRQWLEIFVKTLLVYPIIAAIFAMSDVFGAIIFGTAATGPDSQQAIKIITGIMVIYAPLILIPFAFRFAGGVMGRLASVATTGARKVAEVGPIKGRRDIAKRDWGNKQIQYRSDAYNRLQARQARSGVVGKRAYRGLAGAIGGYNIEEQASALRAQTDKTLNDQINSGRDDEIRGLTVNKRTANQGAWETGARADGFTYGQNDLRRRGADGTMQYKSLGGAWVNEAHVDAGQKRWGRDSFAQQSALSYEMRKAATNEQVGDISARYKDLATGSGGWGMSDDMAGGAFIGAGFANQGTHLEFKHTNALTGQLNHEAFAREMYEKKGTYEMSRMSGHTFAKLREAHRNGTPETRRMVEAVAESFVTRYGGGGGGGQVQHVGEDGTPVLTQGDPLTAQQPRGASQEVIRTNTQGAASVSEEVRRLAVDVGVLRPLDPSTETYSATDNTTGRPRQG